MSVATRSSTTSASRLSNEASNQPQEEKAPTIDASESCNSVSGASPGPAAAVELREVEVQGFRCFGNNPVLLRLDEMAGLVAVSGRNEADSKDEAGAHAFVHVFCAKIVAKIAMALRVVARCLAVLLAGAHPLQFVCFDAAPLEMHVPEIDVHWEDLEGSCGKLYCIYNIVTCACYCGWKRAALNGGHASISTVSK
jgi:hypothetical protein